MPAWLLPLLRVIGLGKVQTEAVGAALELAREIEATIETAGDDPPQPLSHRDVDHIEAQRDRATSFKVPPPPPRPRKGPHG
jgi:hypothetical protein